MTENPNNPHTLRQDFESTRWHCTNCLIWGQQVTTFPTKFFKNDYSVKPPQRIVSDTPLYASQKTKMEKPTDQFLELVKNTACERHAELEPIT